MSKQVANNTKRISEQSKDSISSQVNHQIHETSNKINTTTTGLPNAKIAIKTNSKDNPALAPRSFGFHEEVRDNNNTTGKRIQIDDVPQTNKIATSAKRSISESFKHSPRIDT